MSDCCSSHQEDNKAENSEDKVEEKPKSFISKAFKDEGFIGKYLYKLGKEDAMKVSGKGKDCC